MTSEHIDGVRITEDDRDPTPEQEASWLAGYGLQRECPFHFECDCTTRIDGPQRVNHGEGDAYDNYVSEVYESLHEGDHSDGGVWNANA